MNGGGIQIRTGDGGFADLCLSHLAMPPYYLLFNRIIAGSAGSVRLKIFKNGARDEI